MESQCCVKCCVQWFLLNYSICDSCYIIVSMPGEKPMVQIEYTYPAVSRIVCQLSNMVLGNLRFHCKTVIIYTCEGSSKIVLFIGHCDGPPDAHLYSLATSVDNVIVVTTCGRHKLIDWNDDAPDAYHCQTVL